MGGLEIVVQKWWRRPRRSSLCSFALSTKSCSCSLLTSPLEEDEAFIKLKTSTIGPGMLEVLRVLVFDDFANLDGALLKPDMEYGGLGGSQEGIGVRNDTCGGDRGI
mmetsp:Transcript_7903/g.15831  ORF Transcript_7903/g.15831 Transcript_7903/m.15831 type:complete len:107 (-) Transcript_7903:89-409(-)